MADRTETVHKSHHISVPNLYSSCLKLCFKIVTVAALGQSAGVTMATGCVDDLLCSSRCSMPLKAASVPHTRPLGVVPDLIELQAAAGPPLDPHRPKTHCYAIVPPIYVTLYNERNLMQKSIAIV